jgi:hypothetical protein
MITRLGQAMPHFLVGTNVAGEGLRERLRSTTFAFFGLVTATGLVLVGIAYNQGWPDFVNSPIPGIPTQRVGDARIAAGAAKTIAPAGAGTPSHRFAAARKAQLVPGRSSGHHVTSQQQAPVAVSGGHVRGPAPSGYGGVDAPAPPAPAPVAPAPQAAAQPPAAQPPAAQSPAPDPVPAQESAPVATSPPASKVAPPAPGNGKAKGHEKSHGTSTAPAPVVPKAPSPPPAAPAPPSAKPPAVPAEPAAPAKEAPPPAGEQPGKGHAYGHYK